MQFSRFLSLILLPLFLVGAVKALASDTGQAPIAVVELFTSQGCSSCPPADAYLAELDTRPDVLALAYHVDYWDYIGWKDTFADAAYSDLQRAYAHSMGKNRIYTPQIVINGAIDIVGSHRDAVEHQISSTNLPVIVELLYGDGFLNVNIGASSNTPESMIYLVTYRERAEVRIERGENRGQTITYAQIVTSRQVVGMWDPEAGSHLKLPLRELLGESSDGVAILVQQHAGGLPGPILGAARFEM